jgi:hypothetical protein
LWGPFVLVDAILTPTREPSLLSSQVQQGPGHPLQKGEASDIAISSGPLMDQLQAQGKVIAGSRVNIAKACSNDWASLRK